MVFTATHLYMTFHWTAPSAADEEGQFGIRANQASIPTSAEVDAIAAAAATFWGTAANEIPTPYQLYQIKFALIQPDGHYPDGFVPEIHTYAPPLAGGGGSSTPFPLQIACVGSLLTSAVRGRAHRGRIYMPPLSDAVTSSSVWSSAAAQARANGLATMLSTINGNLAGSVAVMSSIGAGLTRVVTSVAVGTKPDVQRRRARSVPEAYSTAVLT